MAAWTWPFRKEQTLKNWGKIVRIIPSTVVGPCGSQCSRRAEALGLPPAEPAVLPLPLQTANVAVAMRLDANGFHLAYVATLKKSK